MAIAPWSPCSSPERRSDDDGERAVEGEPSGPADAPHLSGETIRGTRTGPADRIRSLGRCGAGAVANYRRCFGPVRHAAWISTGIAMVRTRRQNLYSGGAACALAAIVKRSPAVATPTSVSLRGVGPRWLPFRGQTSRQQGVPLSGFAVIRSVSG